MKFVVITKINLKGNLYNPILYKNNGEIWSEAMRISYLDGDTWHSPLAENFELGEVLVMDDEGAMGRELTGRKRAPRKWDVECEEFSTVEEAIKRSDEVDN